MTIRQLESSLPSGFHDALLHSYAVDLTLKEARFRLELCVGDPNSPDEDIRDAYAQADLLLTGLVYLSVDTPDPTYDGKAPWQIDLCDADPEVAGLRKPPNGFAARFYSSDTNAFIHFAALTAEVVFLENKAGSSLPIE